MPPGLSSREAFFYPMSKSGQTPSRWDKQGETILTRTRIFDLRTARYRHPVRETERDFYVVHSPDWVNVIALTPKYELVLVRQFRFGVEDFSIEIPGGVMDLGEEPVAAGLRELREETGYTGKNARIIGRVHSNPAILSNACHFVFVEDVRQTDGLEWDTDEEIEVMTVPVDQVYQWAFSGKITHSLVLDALLCFLPIWNEMKKL
ncbi:MAG: NUDIX hydrolase [Nibricoccus sp.]